MLIIFYLMVGFGVAQQLTEENCESSGWKNLLRTLLWPVFLGILLGHLVHRIK